MQAYTQIISIYIYISYHYTSRIWNIQWGVCRSVCVCVSDKKNPVSCPKVCPNGIESIDHESCVDVFEICIGPNAFFQVAWWFDLSTMWYWGEEQRFGARDESHFPTKWAP